MTTTPVSTPHPAMDRFFDTLRRSPLRRSSAGVFGGVCAAIAERFGVSTAVVRIATVVLSFFGIGVPLYLIAWLLLPDAQGHLHVERAIRYGGAPSIVLLVVVALVLVPDLGSRAFWGLAVAGVVGFFAWRHYRNRPTTAASAPPSAPAPYGQPYAYGPQYPGASGQPSYGQPGWPPAAPPQDAPRG